MQCSAKRERVQKDMHCGGVNQGRTVELGMAEGDGERGKVKGIGRGILRCSYNMSIRSCRRCALDGAGCDRRLLLGSSRLRCLLFLVRKSWGRGNGEVLVLHGVPGRNCC
jgi:hypothetical protein